MLSCTPLSEAPKVISFRLEPREWEGRGLSYLSLRAAYDFENLYVVQLTTPDYAPAVVLSKIVGDKPATIPLAGKDLTIFENENSQHTISFLTDLSVHRLLMKLESELADTAWGVCWEPTRLFPEDKPAEVLAIRSNGMGTKTRFKVMGDAAVVLGMYSTRFARGSDAHLRLRKETSVYTFLDPFWTKEARYFVRLCDSDKNPMTDFTLVREAKSTVPLVDVNITVIDLQGEPVAGVELLVSGIWTQEKNGNLISGCPKVFKTDETGTVTVPLVPGSIVHLTMAQIAWSKEYEVPLQGQNVNMVVVPS